MPKIFISYRRDDSESSAHRISEELVSRFDDQSVFMDVDAIPMGVDFRKHIIDAVAECDVLLALIGERWLGVRRKGKRRLDNPGDFVRIEIEAALRRSIPVIPILIGKAALPRAQDLPRALADLAYRNATRVDSGRDFHVHMDRLLQALEAIGPAERPVRRRKQKAPNVTIRQRRPTILDCTSARGADARRVKSAQKEWADFLGLPIDRSINLGNRIRMAMRLIPPGKFMMGSPSTEKDRSSNETIHAIELTEPFYLGVYPVTFGQFTRFVRDKGDKSVKEMEGKAFVFTGSEWKNDPKAGWRNPGFRQTAQHPVVCVSAGVAEKFLGWLAETHGEEFRLPTEAQWEYACRAGTRTRFYFGAEISSTDTNFQNSIGHTSKVGSYAANSFGLFDMHGNVWESCRDFFDESYYIDSAKTNPECTSGSIRVIRGGSWGAAASRCRSAYRGRGDPEIGHFLGFRAALIPNVTSG